jgi:REP element-mobilizing transposase RayT
MGNRRTIGYHIVKSGYGLWLPGDESGSWSSAWDEQIGYYEPHMLHNADPVRRRMAAERMKHPAVRLTQLMIDAVANAIDTCTAESEWNVAAISIEPTHMHLQLTYTTRDIDKVCKWIAQQMTKAIREQTGHAGPIWAKGKWCSFIFDDRYWETTRRYIERHNQRRGLPAQPYTFIK